MAQEFHGPAFVAAAAGEAHAQEHVLQGRKSGQEIERLEDVADVVSPKPVPAMFGKLADVAARHLHQARIGPADAGNHVQQCRLAAAATAHQRHLLAGRHPEFRNVQDRESRSVGLGERLLDVLQEQHA